MNLSPPNPNFLEARDAILQADLVNTGGTNQQELWAAFAKRGLGFTSTAPASSTTIGLHEAFDIPDALRITPAAGFIGNGPVGGPFNPVSVVLTLTNASTNSLNWSLLSSASWLSASVASGTLPVGGSAAVTVGLDDSATNLAAAIYPATLWFTNLNSGVVQSRQFYLRVGQGDHDDVGELDGFGGRINLEALFARNGDGLAALIEADDDVQAALLEIQRMGVAL